MHRVFAKIVTALGLLVMPFFILISVLANNYWMVAILIVGYVGELYAFYRYTTGTRKVKHLMDSQRPTMHYYYDIWYKPADATRESYMAEKLREFKKKIRRK